MTRSIRDLLALSRTKMANERTLLAYIRTGVAFIAAGVGIIQFIRDGYGVLLSGCLLIATGIIFLYVGAHRYHKNLILIEKMYLELEK